MLYLHCSECISRDQPDKIAARYTGPYTLEIICESHDPPMRVNEVTLVNQVVYRHVGFDGLEAT